MLNKFKTKDNSQQLPSVKELPDWYLIRCVREAMSRLVDLRIVINEVVKVANSYNEHTGLPPPTSIPTPGRPRR